MRPGSVIQTKRDGGELSPAQIDAFVAAAARPKGSGWEKYHLSALLMAIYLNGMSPAETAHLTRAMADSGKRLDLSDLPGPKVDKHSTGGVGDKTSLILGPLAAACGVVVPMMSGRGLEHTGGTLDKLEAIPGFNVHLSERQIQSALTEVGLCIVGQTPEIAPADKALYALRDVTATVASIPLITASILSKKLAEGIGGLVMDVKCGRGTFMKTRDQARALADSLVAVGTVNGLKLNALITAMDAPLGRCVGHTLEVIEAIDTLKGNGPADVTELSVLLTARMVRLAGVTADDAEAQQRVRAALASGAGLEVFRRCIERQGGDAGVLDDYGVLPQAGAVAVVEASRHGWITSMDAEKVGAAVHILGGGRRRAEEKIDHAVGIVVRARPGEAVEAGQAVFEVHHQPGTTLPATLPLLRSAFAVGETPPAEGALVLEEVG